MFGKKTDKKKKVKNSTKTAATIASQKPISQLTKEDKDVMQQRMVMPLHLICDSLIIKLHNCWLISSTPFFKSLMSS